MKREKPVIVLIAVSGLMAALVCVTTMLIQIPIPATGGYINVGDAMIMTSALIFGTAVGGFAGGVGSALADIITGWGVYAPLTLIVKGIEGAIVGKLSSGKDWKRDVLAVIIGGSVMVVGYFLGEAFVMGYGVPAALAEVPGNIFQATSGGIISIPLSLAVRRYLSVPRW